MVDWRDKKAYAAHRRALYKKMGCPDDKHGTATGYTLYACRCRPCTEAQNDYQRARRSGPRVGYMSEADTLAALVEAIRISLGFAPNEEGLRSDRSTG